MTALRKSYVDVSGGQLHVRRIAADAPTVVFLHQTASSGEMWAEVMERLARRWDLIALDTPGFGGSFAPDPDSQPSMDDYVGWIGEALDALNVARCHLVGHHTGSAFAVQLAIARAALPISLTLFGPAPLRPPERKEASKSYGSVFEPTATGGYLLDNWDYLRKLGATADPLLANREMALQLRAWRGRVQAYAAMWDQDFAGLYGQLRCPIMIAAAPDDVLHPFLDRAKSMQPGAELLPVSGGAFEPDLDAETVAAGLATFLSKHDRS